MRTEKEGNEPIDDEANPEIDEQAEIRQEMVGAMLRRRRQVRHNKEINYVPQHHGSQRDEEISRKAHSLH